MIAGLARPFAPEDLRTSGAVPRPKSVRWCEGDLVQIDGVRWIIRVLNGDCVELESTNARCAIWWTTTLDKLPPKVA